LAWAASAFGCRWDTFPSYPWQRQCLQLRLSPWRSHLRPPRRLPKQSVRRRTTGKLVTTGIDEYALWRHRSASLEVSYPLDTISRGACLVSKGGQPSDARLGTIQITVLLETADAFGNGSFSDISSHEMTRLPSSMTFRRRCDRCNRSRITLAKGPAISSDAVWTSCRPSASCTVASFVGAVFRYAVRTSTALPGDALFLLPSISRPAALLGSSALRRFVPADGWLAFLPFRAHVSLRRRASAPINFRRGDRSPDGVQPSKRRSAGDLVFGVAFDFWALTPICDPHPPARGQRTDPALGFASCRVC